MAKSATVQAVVPVIDSTQLSQVLALTTSATNVLLAGRHGIGKSEIVTRWGRAHGYNVVVLFLGQVGDPGDLIGMPSIRDGRTEYVPAPWWPCDGKPVLLFLDELNRASRAIQSSVFDLVLNKMLMGRSLPEGSRVMAAINAGEAYDVRDMDAALVSRFTPFMFEPTVDEWLAWADGAGIDARVTQFVRDNPAALDTDGAGDVTEQTATLARTPDRRAWARFGRDLNAGLPYDLVQQLILTATVGHTVAQQFTKCVEKYSSVKWILDNNKILGKPCIDWGTWVQGVFDAKVADKMLPILKAHPHPEIQVGAMLLQRLVDDETLRIQEIELKRRDPLKRLSLKDLPPMTLHPVTVAAPAVTPKGWKIDEKLSNMEWAVSVHGGPIQRPPVLAGKGKGVDWGGSDYTTEHGVPVLVNCFIARMKSGAVLCAFGHYHQYLSIEERDMPATGGPRCDLTTDTDLPEALRTKWKQLETIPSSVTIEFYSLMRDTIVAMEKAGRLSSKSFRCDDMAARAHEACI